MQEVLETQFDPWVGKILWRRAWQLTPVFLPGESHGQRRLAGYSPQGRKQSDTIEETQHASKHKEWQTIVHGPSWDCSQFLYSWNKREIYTFFFFIYFCQLEANYFTILQCFFPYIDMNQPWIYMCSPSKDCKRQTKCDDHMWFPKTNLFTLWKKIHVNPALDTYSISLEITESGKKYTIFL